MLASLSGDWCWDSKIFLSQFEHSNRMRAHTRVPWLGFALGWGTEEKFRIISRQIVVINFKTSKVISSKSFVWIDGIIVLNRCWPHYCLASKDSIAKDTTLHNYTPPLVHPGPIVSLEVALNGHPYLGNYGYSYIGYVTYHCISKDASKFVWITS